MKRTSGCSDESNPQPKSAIQLCERSGPVGEPRCAEMCGEKGRCLGRSLPTWETRLLGGISGTWSSAPRKHGRFRGNPANLRWPDVSRPANQEGNKEPEDTRKVKIESSLGGHRASGKTQTVYIMPGGIPPIPPMPPAPGGGPISDGLIFFDAITSSILRIIDATSVAD